MDLQDSIENTFMKNIQKPDNAFEILETGVYKEIENTEEKEK